MLKYLHENKNVIQSSSETYEQMIKKLYNIYKHTDGSITDFLKDIIDKEEF